MLDICVWEHLGVLPDDLESNGVDRMLLAALVGWMDGFFRSVCCSENCPHPFSSGQPVFLSCCVFVFSGLTLLVPYLLTRRKSWRTCKIRVFIIGDEQNMDERREE